MDVLLSHNWNPRLIEEIDGVSERSKTLFLSGLPFSHFGTRIVDPVSQDALQEANLTVADAAAGKEAIGHCLVLGLSDLTASWADEG